ncbi:MAG TPA: TonB-dependent receptor [Bryobacteraceae bacterium]
MLNQKQIARAVEALLLIGVFSVTSWAQSTQGGVRGAVSDASGAMIAGVKVTLTNDATGEPRSALTNSNGGYAFNDVVPATYTLTAESPSFKKFERKNVIVATQEFLTVDVKLEVGAVTESVLVTDQVPLVETTNASQGQVLDNQKLVDLPNLGRNPFMMSKLSQNVVQVGPPAYNRMEDQSGSSMISIAGGPVRGNNYLLDGIPITDADNRAIIIPSLEAVQEVKIQANTYDAEMARTGGGMFNTLMRSGTNEYHGSAYGHLRRTDWDANSFFSNAAGIPITNQPNTTWGASFGGKVWIPKLYDGKNKTFFYLAVEHYDDTQSDSATFATPTALERTGNFSQSKGITVIDPTTGQPFLNNIIPVSRLNPVGVALANQFQLPTSAPSTYGGTDLTAASAIKARAVQYTSKIDEDFMPWWHASLSYLRYYSLEPGDTWFNSPSTPSGWRLQRRVDTTQLNNIFTINPTTVLAVRYGFNRFPNYDYNSSQGYNVADLGFSPAYANSISPTVAEFPSIAMTSMYSLGDTGDNSFYVEASKNASASLDKYIGRHSLKVGVDYRRLATAGYSLNYPTGQYTFNTSASSTSYTSVDMGDLLLGLPYQRQADTASHFSDYINYYGLYVQDDFRLSSKITVNYGLRWERELGTQEVNNGLVVGFNTTTANVLASSVSGISPKGAVEYAGLNGNPTAVGNYNSNKWGPRVGIAWQLNSKTVVRGGYGIFWAPQIALGAPISTLGYSATTTFVGSLTGAGAITPTLANPFPAGLVQPSGNSLGTAAGLGQNFSLVDPNAKSPKIQQYSIDVQRQLPGNIAFEIGYVGSHTSNLTLGAPNIDINALNPSYFSSVGIAGLNTVVSNPYYGLINSGTLSAASVQQYLLLRPYSTYGNIDEIFSSQNHARYDSMILKAQKRFSQGLTFLSTFTWSKNMDESSGGAGNSLNGGAQNAPQNPYNLAAEYSLANIDTPLRWATAISYELPFGTGKPFLHSSKLLDAVVGGWTINAVSVYQTGFPLQIYQTNNNSAYGYEMQRPNATGVSPDTSGSVESRISEYINPAAFSLAPAGTFGNVSRAITELGPGQKNWDLSVFKSYTIKERFKAQFRCETLNGFNSPLFASPVTNLSSGTFGHITSQANFSRQLQLALRFSF